MLSFHSSHSSRSCHEDDDEICTRTSSSSAVRKKSSLRRGSSYGNAEEGIPLDFERQEYNRVLPKPDMILLKATTITSGMPRTRHPSSGRGLFRGLGSSQSEPVFVRPVYLENIIDNAIDITTKEQQERRRDQLQQLNTDVNSISITTTDIDIVCGDDNIDRVVSPSSSSSSSNCAAAEEGGTSTSTSTSAPPTHKRKISFGSIEIREHSQTIGDNPSCSYGIPVQLDWDYEQLDDIKVEEYEANRNRRPLTPTRSRQEPQCLNYYQRKNLVQSKGFSKVDINDTKKQVSKVRNQRERTKFLVTNYPALTTVEDVIESGTRKLKRTLKATNTFAAGPVFV